MISRIKAKLKGDEVLSLVLKGGGISFIAKVVASAFGVLSGIIIARVYGVEITGTVSILQSVTSLLALFGIMGTNVALIRLTQINSVTSFSLYKQVYHLSLYNSLIWGGAGLVLLQIFPSFFYSDINLIYLLLSTLFLFSYEQIAIAYLRSKKDVKGYALSIIIPSFLRFLLLFISLLFVLEKFPVYLVFCMPLITSLLLFSYINKYHKREVVFTNYSNINILKIGFPMMLTESMYVLISNVDTLMIASILSASHAGVYSIGIGLVLMLTMTISAVQAFSAPKFSEFHHSGDTQKLELLAKQTSKITFFSVAPLVLILIVFGRYLLEVIYGESFVAGYPALIIMAVAFLVKAVCGLSGVFLNMTGNEKIYFKIAAFSCGVNIFLNYILIPKFGITGAAISTAISIMIWNAFSVVFIYKRFGFSIVYVPFLRGKKYIV